MTTLLLVRHGETDAVGKILAGWQPGWHLNRKGREQTDRLVQRLSRQPIRAVYSSPLERAIETATPIASSHGVPLEVTDDLGEMRLGEWEGMSFQELEDQPLWRQFNASRASVRAPGGELMIETQSRVLRQVERVAKCRDGQTVAMFSHADPLRALIAHALGIPLDFILRFEISPASVSVMEWGIVPRLLCLNETGEIPL